MKRLFKRSGGQILVDALKTHGVTRAFSVAGESYLDVLNALIDAPEIDLVTCRQEGGAAFMAEAHGKLTGKPGICFVTRGPGACNAAIGVHTAMQDSTPLILFVGQVARDQKGREAFQEIDYGQMFAPPMTKWVGEITDIKRIPEMVTRAFSVATSGRPGPVVLSLPEDMLRDKAVQASIEKISPYKPVVSYAGKGEVHEIKEILNAAERPVAIIGGSGWTEKAIGIFESFAKSYNLPVATSFRRQDAFDNRHECYIGELGTGPNPALVERIKQADVVLAIGTRLSEITTQGYTLLEAPIPKQKLIHVYVEAEELGKTYHPALGMQAGTLEFCELLYKYSWSNGSTWKDWMQEAHQDYINWTELKSRDKFKVDMDGIIADLRLALPEDGIITTDAGNFSGWAQRYIRYARPGRLLAPTSGAMGYGVPSAISASLEHPDRVVVGLMGDGGFMMTGQELATARHTGAKPIFIVFNNNMYGTIRMHQEKNYPGRVSATDLTNPDFTALAKSYGMEAFCIEKTEDFMPIFKQVMESGQATLLEIKMDPQQITTQTTLDNL